MIAVDTNVVVRFLVADDPHQADVARDCVASGIFVSHGVLMETEWVLRTVYRLRRSRIADSLGDFIELETVHVDDLDDLRWAVGRYRLRGDWPDMLHLIASRAQAEFATFDQLLPRHAGNDAPVTIQVLK
jgi:predicted nucleic-acid-binding protein